MEDPFRFNVDPSLAGRVIAITGGAGGIGLSTTQAFLQSGARVLLIDVDNQRLEAARARFGETQVVYHASRLDSPEACAQALGLAGGPVFALVHLAGIVERDFFDPAQRGIWDRSIAANLTSAYDMSVAFLRQADTSNGFPRIVLTSSMAYRRGGIGGSSYSAAKGGVAGLMRALSRHLAPGILVNALAPGIIETPMTVTMRETRHDELMREIPLQRFGKPHEVAGVIHFLCGSTATFITGQVINIDGGQVNS